MPATEPSAVGPSTPVIRLERLTKSFGARRGVIDIDLEVEPGGIFGFLGPNGAGKSTTIRCLLGLYVPTGGRVSVLGVDPSGGRPELLARVGYLPGELHLPDALTGADLLDRFARMRGLRDTSYRDHLVDRFGAELDRPLRALSKGNRQKIGIVLAFMHRPTLLVLDEPTSGLDPLLRDEFASLVRETVDEGRTVFLSSHDLDEVQRLVQRLAIIREGRIIINDTVEGLRARSPRSIELTFDHDVSAASVAAVPGVTVTARTPRTISLSHIGSAAPVLAAIASLEPITITARPADLDELFLNLYSGRPVVASRPVPAAEGDVHA